MGKFLFESDGKLVIAEDRNVSLMYYTSAGDLLMFGIQNSPETHPDIDSQHVQLGESKLCC